jgi:hypothetical protein
MAQAPPAPPPNAPEDSDSSIIHDVQGTHADPGKYQEGNSGLAIHDHAGSQECRTNGTDKARGAQSPPSALADGLSDSTGYHVLSCTLAGSNCVRGSFTSAG